MGSVKRNLDPVLLTDLKRFYSNTLGMALETLGANGRRDKITIMADLLDIMQEPRRLTHILYKSNMSYVQLVKYLDDLMDRGLAEKRKEPYRCYSITDNGKLFRELVRRNGNSSALQ